MFSLPVLLILTAAVIWASIASLQIALAKDLSGIPFTPLRVTVRLLLIVGCLAWVIFMAMCTVILWVSGGKK